MVHVVHHLVHHYIDIPFFAPQVIVYRGFLIYKSNYFFKITKLFAVD